MCETSEGWGVREERTCGVVAAEGGLVKLNFRGKTRPLSKTCCSINMLIPVLKIKLLFLATPLTPDLSHSQGLLLQLGCSLCYQLVNGFESLGKRCLQVFVGRLELLVRLLHKLELCGGIQREEYLSGEGKEGGKEGEEEEGRRG